MGEFSIKRKRSMADGTHRLGKWKKGAHVVCRTHTTGLRQLKRKEH